VCHPIKTHTCRKYDVFSACSAKWIQEIRKSHDTCYYIDLTAGPGVSEVEGSRDKVKASPLIAISTQPPFSKCVFVEKDARYASTLRARLSRYAENCPVEYAVFNRDSNDLLIESFWHEVLKNFSNVPCLVCVDPEGPLDIAWKTIEWWLRKDHCDVIMIYPPPQICRSYGRLKNRTYVRGLHRALPPGWDVNAQNAGNPKRFTEVIIGFCKSKIGETGRYVSELCLTKGPKHNILYPILFATENKTVAEALDEASHKNERGN